MVIKQQYKRGLRFSERLRGCIFIRIHDNASYIIIYFNLERELLILGIRFFVKINPHAATVYNIHIILIL